jgi:ABC-type uncharacterized transport system permease subunit
MKGQSTKNRLANKILVVGVGILVIAGLVIMSKVFFRGMLIGVALAFAGCIITLFWMNRSMRRKR